MTYVLYCLNLQKKFHFLFFFCSFQKYSFLLTVAAPPTDFDSSYNGCSATAIGSKAYMQFHEYVYEMTCDSSTSQCSWTTMNQKLSPGLYYAEAMVLPTDFTC